MDRTFVLGSDELYREWGYTALSRHRLEARFYVTGATEFLNEPPAALQMAGASDQVARLLAGTRAERLALEAQQLERRATALDHAQERLADAEARLETLVDERAATGWHRPGRRRQLDGLITDCQSGRQRRELDVRRLEAPPATTRSPRLERAQDPLRALEHPRQALDRARARDLGRDL